MEPKDFFLAVLLGFMAVSMFGCDESSESLTVSVVIPTGAVSAAVLEEMIELNPVWVDSRSGVEYKMKIVKPDPNVDYKIVKLPIDPTVDYKIIIVEPETGREIAYLIEEMTDTLEAAGLKLRDGVR